MDCMDREVLLRETTFDAAKFRVAYQNMFHKDIDVRVQFLIDNYPNHLVWELSFYGWSPVELQEMLK